MSDTARTLAQWPDSPSTASAQMGRGWLEYDPAAGVYTLGEGAPQGRAGFVEQPDGTYAPAPDTTGQTVAVLAKIGGVVHMLAA